MDAGCGRMCVSVVFAASSAFCSQIHIPTKFQFLEKGNSNPSPYPRLCSLSRSPSVAITSKSRQQNTHWNHKKNKMKFVYVLCVSQFCGRCRFAVCVNACASWNLAKSECENVKWECGSAGFRFMPSSHSTNTHTHTEPFYMQYEISLGHIRTRPHGPHCYSHSECCVGGAIILMSKTLTAQKMMSIFI